MMKLRIAAGLGLVLFMATMIGGPVGVSQADADPVTLADLAGKFASRGGGFFTLCVFSGARISCSSVSPTLVPFNDTVISHTTRDAAGNSCGVVTITAAPVSGTKFPVTVATRTTVETKASFDPTTGSGTSSFSDYVGGSCLGAVFDGAGTLTESGTDRFVVSDSGNRIEQILTSESVVTALPFSVAGSVAGDVFSQTLIRQSD